MFTKLVFHCDRSISGKIFNSDIGQKNGVTIEELLINNYSFKRSGFFVRSVSVQERNTLGGIDVSIYIKHDRCPVDFLVSFARNIISRCDINKISLKTCDESEFYFGYVAIKNTSLEKLSGIPIVSIFCDYFSFLMIGHRFPDRFYLDHDLRAKNIKCNSLLGQVVDSGISVYQLSVTNMATFNLVIRHSGSGSDSEGYGVSSAQLYGRNDGELAENDKIASSVDLAGPLFMSIAMSFLDDWVDSGINHQFSSKVFIA